MAKLVVSPEEVKEIMLSNAKAKEHISSVKIEGQALLLTITATICYVPITFDANLHYIGFESGILTFKFEIKLLKGKMLETVANWLINKFKDEFPNSIKIDYPIVTVDSTVAMQNCNVSGICVENVTIEDDSFVATAKFIY